MLKWIYFMWLIYFIFRGGIKLPLNLVLGRETSKWPLFPYLIILINPYYFYYCKLRNSSIHTLHSPGPINDSTHCLVSPDCDSKHRNEADNTTPEIFHQKLGHVFVETYYMKTCTLNTTQLIWHNFAIHSQWGLISPIHTVWPTIRDPVMRDTSPITSVTTIKFFFLIYFSFLPGELIIANIMVSSSKVTWSEEWLSWVGNLS